MLGTYGLYQHARGIEPLLAEGYCVDDNARAVQVAVRLMPHVSASSRTILREAIALCWKYVRDAEYEAGRLYNFRTAEGVWLTQDVSEDMYARVLRCCAVILLEDRDLGRRREAAGLAQRIIVLHGQYFTSPRAWAESLIAVSLLKQNTDYEIDVRAAEKRSLESLVKIWQEHSSTVWPWFEDSLTYANALLHHGILHALGDGNQHALYEDIVRKSSEFLIKTTITQDGIFTPIGNTAWHVKGKEPSLYDQQPIEAGVMLDFLLDLKEYEDTAVTVAQVSAPYLWFFGKNTKQASLVDTATGACFDGLTPNGPNLNCGAESLLAYLWAEARIREASPDVLRYIEEELKRLK